MAVGSTLSYQTKDKQIKIIAHAMDICVGVVQLHQLIITALNDVWQSASCSGYFTSEEYVPHTQ